MKVLVVGNGGREHALAWKIAASPRIDRVFIAPGNAGTANEGENVPIEADDIAGLVKFVQKNSIDLTVVGPQAPRVAGLVDVIQRENLRGVGPARLDVIHAVRSRSTARSCSLLQRGSFPDWFKNPRRSASAAR